MSEPFDIVVRRVFQCPPAFLFDAWTRPEHLVKWWGPEGVICPGADVELRVGGRYAIHNELPDGSVIIIRGEFLEIDPPNRLVYTWATSENALPEQVTVRFLTVDAGTELVIRHEQIRDEETYRTHTTGWNGCMAGLEAFILA